MPEATTYSLDAAEILLVFADSEEATLVGAMLEAAGSSFELRLARSVSEALAGLTRRTACVLAELDPPDQTGLTQVKRLLAEAGTVPVIVVTEREDQALGQVAVALGAQDCIVKHTLPPSGLLQSIRFAIERKKGEVTARELQEARLLAAEKGRLERGLLARPVLGNPRLHWAARYRPGGGRALLGGDFYDGIETDKGVIRLVIGDVTGHGPDEAALGVALRVAWRTLVTAGVPPEEVIPNLQRVLGLERHGDDVFATVCDLVIDPDLTGAYLRLGGHPSPLIVCDGEVSELDLEQRGPLVGLIDQASWPANRLELGNDWALVLYTDGIIEGHDARTGRLDTAGLVELVREALRAGCGMGGLADMLLSRAEDANGGPLPDDAALLVVGVGERW